MSTRILRRALGCAAALLLAALAPQLARAGKADVVDVKAECKKDQCRFAVTVRHDDEGWSHYANRWEVLDMDGKVLVTRVLRHPHVNEQPVTRGVGWTRIPMEVVRVRVRAHDMVHGDGGAEMVIDLER
ncbi:MAG: hypothetical protein OEM49_00315 [Myxococcales bacterium]|nr:hypothetical protein [Myxococcales bacterium]MDH5305931.1 hypothetical protein [Myxococcales bacterium]MDH5566518.1 hypothetical protein [Myxococcales bacterium]